MKPLNPRPPRTLEIEGKLKGLTLEQKIEILERNEGDLIGSNSNLYGLYNEDFYAAMIAMYRTGKRYKNELEFALYQRNHLLGVIERVENKPLDNHERPFLKIWRANISYFDKRLLYLKSQIDKGLDKTEYSAYTIYELNEILADKTPKNQETKRTIDWKGEKKVLIDLFKQLKNKPLPNGNGTYIVSSYSNLAHFLKENFSCFDKTNISTILRQLEGKDEPKRDKIELKDLLNPE